MYGGAYFGSNSFGSLIGIGKILVAKTKILVYNIQGFVSKTKTLVYNIIGLISKSKTLLYQIRHPLTNYSNKYTVKGTTYRDKYI